MDLARITVKDRQFKLYMSAEDVQKVVDRVASELNRDMAEAHPVFLPIMNGAMMFASDLLKRFQFPCEISCLRYKSYCGLSSTGTIQRLITLPDNLRGRNVVVIEDIVDTGETMKTLTDDLRETGAASVKVVSLIIREDGFKVPLTVDYVGMKMPPLFVVGYGLDYDEGGRNYPGIYVLD